MTNNLDNNQKLSPEEKNALRRQLFRATMDIPYEPRSGYIVHGVVKSLLSIALLVAFPGISILYAAEKALPDQGLLYDLKRGGEEFVASFYISNGDKVAFRETQIKRRVEEATQLALRGSMKPAHAEVLSKDIAAHVAFAEATLEDSAKVKQESTEPKESVKQILAVQQRVLAAVAETQPRETKESITAIKKTTAALEDGLSAKTNSLEVPLKTKNEELLVISEIENLLIVAKLEIRKANLDIAKNGSSSLSVTAAVTSTMERITPSPVAVSSTKIILGETRELRGAGKALEDLQERFETIRLGKEVGLKDDSLENILTDIKVFLALLDSDISLVAGFNFTQTNEADSNDLENTDSSIDTQLNQDRSKSVQGAASSTKEVYLNQNQTEKALSLPEPIKTDPE